MVVPPDMACTHFESFPFSSYHFRSGTAKMLLWAVKVSSHGACVSTFRRRIGRERAADDAML